ncbi:MAG: heat-inducible transcriptional repressor HrcA [Bryobacteraceae bacterium]
MQREDELTPRDQEVLASIVKTFIETGEPVGSRTISKRRRDSLSAASIRNTMADLADEGYLSQPHTSAGRIPTVKAFRCYVKSLHARRVHAADAKRLRDELREVETVVGRVERSSHLLTELTRNMGIALAMPSGSQVLEQIELLALPDRRVLMILVTRDRMVRNRLATLDESISQDELNSIRNYVNRNFAGWPLGEVRSELLRRMEHERAAYDEILGRLQTLYSKGLLEVDQRPEIHMEGASNLVGLDMHLTRETMRDLFRALEEKKRMIEILDQFLDPAAEDLRVQVGLEEAHPAMRELALIGLSFTLPGGISTRIAVLGPMRMQYERVISAVLHMRNAFEHVAG